MRFALESANVGIWDMDYTTGVLRWSETIEAQYGLPPGTFGGTFAAFVERIHPDDRAPMLATIDSRDEGGPRFRRRASGDLARRHGAVAERRRPDPARRARRAGARRWEFRRTSPSASAPRRRCAQSEARKAAILDSVLDCIVTMDADGKVIEFNAAAERTFGYTKAEVMGRPLADVIIPPALRAAHTAGLARYLATGEGPLLGKVIEVTAMRSDGTEFPVELAITAIRSDQALDVHRRAARHFGAQAGRRDPRPSGRDRRLVR